MSITWAGQGPYRSNVSCQASLDMVSGEGSDTLSRVPPWGPEHQCRQRIQNDPVIRRVDARPRDVQSSGQAIRASQSGPLRDSTQQPAEFVHELEAGSLCSGSGCSQTVVEGSTGVCLPSFFPDREVPPEIEAGAVHDCVGGPSVASSTLVSEPSGACGGTPLPSPDLLKGVFNKGILC